MNLELKTSISELRMKRLTSLSLQEREERCKLRANYLVARYNYLINKYSGEK